MANTYIYFLEKPIWFSSTGFQSEHHARYFCYEL